MQIAWFTDGSRSSVPGAIRQRIRGDVRPTGPHRLPQSESGRGDARQRSGAALRRWHPHRAPGDARQPPAGAGLRRRCAPGPLHRVRPAGLAGQRHGAIAVVRRGEDTALVTFGRAEGGGRINNRPVRIQGDQSRPIPRREAGSEDGRRGPEPPLPPGSVFAPESLCSRGSAPPHAGRALTAECLLRKVRPAPETLRGTADVAERGRY